MHRKAVFALAGVFLAVALVVPPVILVLQADNDLDNYIIAQNPTSHQTSGNITVTPDEIAENHQNNLIIIAVVEVVFVPLFVVTLYYGINHPHPHTKEEMAAETQPEQSP